MRDARRLWRVSAGTVAAAWMLQIAVTVHVLGAASASALAVTVLCGTAPMLLLMPVAGAVADRFDVRRTALASTAGQVVCLAAAAIAIAYASLPALTGVYALQGMTAAFWTPLRQRWLYSVVAVEDRAKANASLGSLSGVMTLAGAIGGGLLSSVSPTLAAAAASLLAALAFGQLALIPRPAGGRAAPARTSTLWSDLREGLRAARDLPLARSVIWAGIAWGFIGGGYTVMLAAQVTDGLRGGPVVLGIMFAADGLAIIAGTLLAGRLRPRAHLPVWAVGYVVQGLPWAALFLAPNLPAAFACLALMRLASGCIIGLDNTILLATVPDELRGRIASVHHATYSAVGRLSLAAIGGALSLVGLSTVGVVTGLVSATIGAAWWCASGRRARGAYLGST
ncbi:MFS transporter [Glycomyces sp. L485]|uniref:MFS transporter n=1 Tax=Glycomyces sp. L485 TaxID=2909235 RepID=UPI001F4B05AE|nr:MFS transporter [Glycomyces sp. L485]MCH7229881.1 MFS transporter [Glycomyces sp. L485]